MKKKLIILAGFMLTVVAIVGTIYGIFSSTKTNIKTATIKQNVSLASGSAPKLVTSIKFGASNWAKTISTNKAGTPGLNPTIHVVDNGHILYCLNKNGPSSDSGPTIFEVRQQISGLIGRSYGSCKYGDKVTETSATFWEPSGPLEDALPDLAYIVTEPTTYTSGGVTQDVPEYVLQEAKANSRIVRESDKVATYLEQNNYTYLGTEHVNYTFPIKNSSRRTLSCSSYVQEVLFQMGYTQCEGDEKLWARKDPSLALKDFEKLGIKVQLITDMHKLQPGDILQYGTSFHVTFVYAVYGDSVVLKGVPEVLNSKYGFNGKTSSISSLISQKCYALRLDSSDRVNEVEQNPAVKLQEELYYKIHGMYETDKAKWYNASTGKVNLSENDYYSMYEPHCTDFTYYDWEEWKDDWRNDRWSMREYYRNYSAWRSMMIRGSKGYADFKEWMDNSIKEMTYEEYYYYYRYCKEMGYSMTTFTIPKFYEYMKYTDNNRKPEYLQGDITTSPYSQYLKDMPPYPADRQNGVVGYFLNDVTDVEEITGKNEGDAEKLWFNTGMILEKYHYGDNVGERVKQYTIWFRDGNAKGDGISHNSKPLAQVKAALSYTQEKAMAVKLQAAADLYAIFGTKLEANIKKDPNNALNLQNTTDLDNLKIAGQTSEYLVVGPFSMTYMEGTVNNITFSGIHRMWIEGYNVDGKQVEINKTGKNKKQLDVTEFILVNPSDSANVDGVQRKARYFTPNMTTGSYVDYGEQVYPKSGEQFYIKFKNPNYNNYESVETRTETIDIKIEFQYMRAEAKIQRLKGDQVYGQVTGHSDSYTTDSEGNSEFDSCTITAISEVSDGKYAQDMIEVQGRRALYSQTISLFADKEGKKEFPKITIKLGGYVWEDGKQGKETEVNGVMNGSKSDGIFQLENPDIPLKNVKVTLYEDNPDNPENGVVADLISKYDETKVRKDLRKKLRKRSNSRRTRKRINALCKSNFNR